MKTYENTQLTAVLAAGMYNFTAWWLHLQLGKVVRDIQHTIAKRTLKINPCSLLIHAM